MTAVSQSISEDDRTKDPGPYADISAANRKVQALVTAGPKDGERVNNLAGAIC